MRRCLLSLAALVAAVTHPQHAGAEAVLPLGGKTEILSYAVSVKSGPEVRRGFAVMQFAVPGEDESGEAENGALKFSIMTRMAGGFEGSSSLLWGDAGMRGPERGSSATPGALELSHQTLSEGSSARLQTNGDEIRFYSREAPAGIRVERRPKGLFEDTLLIRTREPFEQLPSGLYSVLIGIEPFGWNGEVPAWNLANVVREDRTFSRTVPAGDFVVRRFIISFNTERGSRQYTYFVEAAPPRRIVSWQLETTSLSGNNVFETAELVASDRVTKSLLDSQEGADLRKRLEIPAQ